MCGVSFIYQRDGALEKARSAVARMNRAQARRGPDANGCRSGATARGAFAIGHTRLRVLDLDARSDQPFGDDRAWLSYNGEIYNHRQIRRELERDGVAFHTHSDTEVLYHALARWDLKALERLQGMFAFVLLRPERGEVLLGRDRMGIKPLHIHLDERQLIVASEAKTIAASGCVDAKLDSLALAQVFRFNHTLGSRSALQSVETLAPGSTLRVRLNDMSRQHDRYFRPRLRQPTARRFRDRVAKLDGAFCRAIESHVQADVPVACYMSGGIDSCGMAAAAHHAIGNKLTTYSMVFPKTSYSEDHGIDATQVATGVDNTKFAIDKTTLDDFVDYVLCAEMPQWWTSDLALKKLARAVAATGTKVALSGEGPDELLAGYDVYRGMKMRRWAERLGLARLAQVTAIRRATVGVVMPWLGLDPAAVGFYLDCHAPHRRQELMTQYGFYPENIATWEALPRGMHDILSPHGRSALERAKEHDRAWFQREVAPQIQGASLLAANLYFETAVRLPNWILHMGDRMSAAHGIELRFPYLDDDVVDAMLALRDSDRIRGLSEKHILKCVHASRLPRAVVQQRKQPLYTPIAAWVGPLFSDPRIKRYWSPESFENPGFFDFVACDRLRQRLVANRFDNILVQMQSEWAVMMVLSTQVLASQLAQENPGLATVGG